MYIEVTVEKQYDTRTKILVILGVIFTVVLAYWLWHGFSDRDVSDITRGANPVRNELESTSREQQEQAETLDRAGQSIDNSISAVERSQQAVADSKSRNSEIQNAERNDETVIRESQSILKRVRERNEAQNESQR